MTQQELLKSLNTEQGAALNAILEQSFNLRGAMERVKQVESKMADMEAEAKKPERQKRKEALMQQKERLEAELAEMKD